MGFGIRILGTSLLSTGYQELRALIIGKLYSSSDLAYYDKGKQFPNLLVTNINSSIGAVLFPKMSNEQDDVEKVKNTARMSIRYGAFFMCPMMLGLAAVAEPFVKIILTDKWLPCVPLLRLFCVIYLFQPIHTANMQAIKALGRSDIYFWLEVIKKAIELVSLILVMKISVEAIAVSMAILTTCFTFVNAFPNAKLLNYRFKEQMIDIASPLIMSAIMLIVVILIGKLSIPLFPLFIMQIVIGMIVYIGLCLLTRNNEFLLIIQLVRNKIRIIK